MTRSRTPTFTLNGRPWKPVRGWNKIGAYLGAHYAPGVGLRFVAGTQQTSCSISAYGRDFFFLLEARGICTIRPSTIDLREYIEPGQGMEDFRSGGAWGISPCGDSMPITTHDAAMRRCAIEIRDMRTGERIESPDASGYDCVRFAQLKGYAPIMDPRCYDDQHLVRAYRFGLLHRDDPFVRMDLEALLHDWKIVWVPRMRAIIAQSTPNQGHGNIGRAWAWGAYLAVKMGDRATVALCRELALHVRSKTTGLLQRLREGIFQGGSPDPWEVSKVPHGVDVAQDFEASMHVLVLFELGLYDEAKQLAATCYATGPKRKWLRWDNGQGAGPANAHNVADSFQAWFGLGRLAQSAPIIARACAIQWPVPKPPHMGGTLGPYPTIDKVREALVAWGDMGKARFFLESRA